MNKFKYAILKSPINAVKANNGEVSLTELLKQQDTLLHFLKNINILARVMPNQTPNTKYGPINDLVITTRKCAVFCNFEDRDVNNSKIELATYISRFFPLNRIHYINFPGTISNRDILAVNDTYYVSISDKTNIEGANQLKEIFAQYKFKVIIITGSNGSLRDNLNYLEYNNLLIKEGYTLPSELKEFNLINVELAEQNGLGCLWVNDTIIMPNNCSKLKYALNSLNKGYIVVGMNDSEITKLESWINKMTIMI